MAVIIQRYAVMQYDDHIRSLTFLSRHAGYSHKRSTVNFMKKIFIGIALKCYCSF